VLEVTTRGVQVTEPKAATYVGAPAGAHLPRGHSPRLDRVEIAPADPTILVAVHDRRCRQRSCNRKYSATVGTVCGGACQWYWQGSRTFKRVCGGACQWYWQGSRTFERLLNIRTR
jgi:hypothetical protein